jgi:uncharacterized membrane protein (UPF0127 family)
MRRYFIGGIIAVVLLLATAVGFRVQSPELRLARSTYELEIADTPAAQQKGLGGRDRLDAHTGMLFPYTEEAERCFWMKDMRFPIDIIWIGDDKRVVHIEHDLSPSTYPNSYCHFGKYVLELNAGEAKKNALQIGSRVDF